MWMILCQTWNCQEWINHDLGSLQRILKQFSDLQTFKHQQHNLHRTFLRKYALTCMKKQTLLSNNQNFPRKIILPAVAQGINILSNHFLHSTRQHVPASGKLGGSWIRMSFSSFAFPITKTFTLQTILLERIFHQLMEAYHLGQATSRSGAKWQNCVSRPSRQASTIATQSKFIRF